MKKTLFLIISLFLSIVPSLSSADVIPLGYRIIDKCVKIVNLNDFPNISLLGYYTGPVIDDYESYLIKNNECLTMGYKLNSFKINWNTQDKAGQVNPDNFLELDESLYGGAVENNDPLKKKTIEYSISVLSDGKVSIEKSRVISEYYDGIPEKIEVFKDGQAVQVEAPIIEPLKQSCLNLNRNLKYGNRDNTAVKDIALLQDYLRSNNYLNSKSTGYFGVLTFKAVKDFQKMNNITSTGFMGPITRAKIKSLTCE
ncbi:hypothetical protein MNSC_06870 [Minisyncoccus archaeophilus]|jgi:hypothetical protein|uniref:peptidoglycan-binding domain-containing protein n=1 Tax=Minisyncoccus archaeiphilus TaxID=3238481 RepID=UPI00399CD07A